MADFWEVPAGDVAQIDRPLLRHFQQAGLTKSLLAQPEDYARQYIGLRRQGRRIVYVNAMWARRAWIAKHAATEFIKLCDGGNMAWGIEYDYETSSFSRFQINY